ncbi:MAG: hypothetical protein ACI9OJ_001301 [Myxococcota bacterium]|jgi:hypothetical protein
MGRARRVWIGYWRAMQRYHRYSVDGLEHLLTGRPALIVGYHGRPIAHDLCMLTVAIHDQLGYLPHGIIHGAVDRYPRVRAMVDDLGFVTGDGHGLAAAIAAGEHVLVTPGGTREGCRSVRDRYRVSWGPRAGYLKLALKYNLPIVPVAARGVDDTYFGFNDGYALGKRVGMPARLPLWFGLGPTGLWPCSLPFPVTIRQSIGAPIEPAELAALPFHVAHERVRDAVQNLLDHKDRPG